MLLILVAEMFVTIMVWVLILNAILWSLKALSRMFRGTKRMKDNARNRRRMRRHINN